MPEHSLNFVLDEIRDLRTRMDERFDTQDEKIAGVGTQVAVLNTQMKLLLGNGQPGEIQKLQGRVGELEKARHIWLGKHTIISGIVASLISAMIATHDHWLGLLKKLP